MRVAMITGSPALGCGVSDYSVALAEALTAAGVDVALITQPTWGPRSVRRVRRRLRDLNPDVVHLQYPTASYRTSLAPHALSVVEPPHVLTLHEASQAHPLRQLSLLALLARVSRVVFTTKAERDHVLRRARWLQGKASVIPIGSAIPDRSEPGSERVDRIVYFGLLTPEKGLDDVLALASLAQARPGTRVLVIGRVEERFADLGASLRRHAEGLPVDWALDLGPEDVAARLASSSVGYLPYPDGASERRSSLLALLANGVATITTPGPYLDTDLTAAVALATDAERAWEIAEWLLDDRSERQALAQRGHSYAASRDWASIAQRHVDVYVEVLDRSTSPVEVAP